MSSTGVLEVAFEGDIYEEKLAYTGETITLPFEKPSTTGFSPAYRFTEPVINIQRTRITVPSKAPSVPWISRGPTNDVSRQLPSTSKGELPYTPTINFISESDPARAFSPTQPPGDEIEPPSTLTVLETQQLRDALLQSIVKCMQIQNSLYRLVLVKLQAHVTADGQTGSQRDSPEAPSTERPTAGSLNLGAAWVNRTEDAESLYEVPKDSTIMMSRGSVDATPESLSSRKSLNYVPKADSSPVVSLVGKRRARRVMGKKKAKCKGSLSRQTSREARETTGDESVPKASLLKSAGCSLNEIPKAQSRESSIETSKDDVSEVLSGESTEETPNEAKATATGSPEKNLRDFLKAPIEECAEKCPMASVTLGDPEANLNDVPETSKMDRPQETLNDASSTLLCELEKPLEALMRCTKIQRTLFQRLISLNLIATEGAMDSIGNRNPFGDDDLELHIEERVDLLAVQSKLEQVAFKTEMEGNYFRNPFTKQVLKPQSSTAVIKRLMKTGGLFHSLRRELPHGRGTLATVTGDFIYSGDWRRGQRHGKGKGLIFSTLVHSHLQKEAQATIGSTKNIRHGLGKMMFSSGAVHEGQWQFDKMNGYGTLKLPDGSAKKGTWKEGLLHGCVLFTWPHGVVEYREYNAGVRAGLSSCAIEKGAEARLSRMSSIKSQLVELQGCVILLRDEINSITEQLNTQKTEQAALIVNFKDKIRRRYEEQREKDLQTHAEKLNKALKAAEAKIVLEVRKKYDEKWERESQKQREEFDNALKEAQESLSESKEITKLQKELEETKESLMCQICFTRPRDCIILPCYHLLYCRVCVNEHKRSGDSRCPTCRRTIDKDILCFI